MFKRFLLPLALLLLISAGVALFIFYRLRDRPTPTVHGWRAAITTFAGDGAPGATDAATPAQARFHNPFGVAVDRRGNVYVADAGDSNRIRKIDAQSAAVTTLAGGAEGSADGAGGAASFNTPSALAIDANGNLYVADTSNNRIRKVTPEGLVTTIAGDGTTGARDGAASVAQFNAPVGVAVDARGERVYVADTYNDRIRLITTADGQVTTIAGGNAPGYADGAGSAALFDTPCALVANADGELFIADTGNRRLRKLSKDGQVSTINPALADGSQFDEAFKPIGLALTHDKFLYITERERNRIWQLAPDERTAHLIAGTGAGTSSAEVQRGARFNQPAGIAVDKSGALYVADSANYLVRKLTASPQGATATSNAAATSDATTNSTAAAQDALTPGASTQAAYTQPGNFANEAAPPVEGVDALPRLSADVLGIKSLPWPLDPQDKWHEVTATLGEVRGSYDTTDSRHHLHSGIDIFGTYGQTVRAVLDEKVESPLTNWGHGGLNEGFRVGVMIYVHLRVGRNERDELIDETRFTPQRDAGGKLTRVRLKRGTRFRVGDALGTINRMYHVHMNFGAPNAELNPLKLPLVGFTDSIAPRIERDGVQLFDAGAGGGAGSRLTEKQDGRLLVGGQVRVVVDAYDQVDGNQSRRRLGLYKLGYQLIRTDGTPAPGFEQPRITLEFDRMPPDMDAVKVAYADESGITVYGSKSTRFLYEATNIVRHGYAARSAWNTSELPAGDYTLRIIAADYHGNEATAGRDVEIRIEGK